MYLNGRKLPLNRFQHFYREELRNHFQHRIALVGAIRVLVSYSWLYDERILMFRVIYKHNKASLRALECLALV